MCCATYETTSLRTLTPQLITFVLYGRVNMVVGMVVSSAVQGNEQAVSYVCRWSRNGGTYNMGSVYHVQPVSRE
jgi:hypothetical protein